MSETWNYITMSLNIFPFLEHTVLRWKHNIFRDQAKQRHVAWFVRICPSFLAMTQKLGRLYGHCNHISCLKRAWLSIWFIVIFLVKMWFFGPRKAAKGIKRPYYANSSSTNYLQYYVERIFSKSQIFAELSGIFNF